MNEQFAHDMNVKDDYGLKIPRNKRIKSDEGNVDNCRNKIWKFPERFGTSCGSCKKMFSTGWSMRWNLKKNVVK